MVLRCHSLVSLSLSGCTHLSDDNIIDIVDSCAKIVKLELAFCRELTDSVLHAIAKHLSLEELNLSRCVRITDEECSKSQDNLLFFAICQRRVKVICRKLEEVFVTSAVEAIESKEQQEREEGERLQHNEVTPTP
ncbi:Leucine-rich repeat domain, L domain-like [Phytophthora cactorum]|nr:Leucine-rich repeat domain, L domain-like [Phytophthora cactorum]